MATLRQIKDKQNSVSTINKITKAMQLVSSAKSQKAIKAKKEYEDYFNKVEKMIGEVSGNQKTRNDFKGTYWIVIMSNLGLAGGYNNNILKTLKSQIDKNDKVLIIGQKGMSFKNQEKDKVEVINLEELNHSHKLEEITVKIKALYYDDDYQVKVIYTKYISAMDFQPTTKIILPIQRIAISNNEKETKQLAITLFEPERSLLLKELEGLYIHSFLVGIFRESQASEHTSRKNAMEAATKNGEELLDALNIEYNRGRQAKITQEISEIIGGAESLK